MPVMSVAADEPGIKPNRILGCRTGPEAGPTLVIVGGIHGNEPSGLIAAERVLAALEEAGLPRRGRVVALRGNLTALVACDPKSRGCPRYIDVDLNRLFDSSSPNGVAEGVEHRERRALEAAIGREVAEARGRVYLIDLHTVSSDSPPFVAVEDSLAARRFAMAFPLPKILGIEEELRGLLIDDATNRLGCISMVIESGRHDDPFSIDVHEAAIWLALAESGIVPLDAVGHAEDPRALLRRAARGRADHFYEIRYREVIRSRDFRIRPGIDAFVPVRAKRTVIAEQDGQPLVAPVGGLVFMPNRQTDPRPGDDAYFIVGRVGRVWLRMSAWLRTKRWVHAIQPVVLPGVRRRPGHEHDLLVAPEIAVIFRHQLFHLLGYRVIRRGPQEFASPPARAVRAVRAVVAALWRLAVGVLRGGERAALPTERPDDWIVRRRKLDVD